MKKRVELFLWVAVLIIVIICAVLINKQDKELKSDDSYKNPIIEGVQ